MQPETGFGLLKRLAPCQLRNTSATNASFSPRLRRPSAVPPLRFFNELSAGLLILAASPVRS